MSFIDFYAWTTSAKIVLRLFKNVCVFFRLNILWHTKIRFRSLRHGLIDCVFVNHDITVKLFPGNNKYSVNIHKLNIVFLTPQTYFWFRLKYVFVQPIRTIHCFWVKTINMLIICLLFSNNNHNCISALGLKL